MLNIRLFKNKCIIYEYMRNQVSVIYFEICISIDYQSIVVIYFVIHLKQGCNILARIAQYKWIPFIR